MQRVYRQVCSKRAISEDQFSRGLIDFDFSIGGQTVWIPNRSYFRVGLQIVNKTVPATQVQMTDNVTFANYCPGNLFDNCFFMAGGQNVSSITNYSGQAHAAAYRLKKSGFGSILLEKMPMVSTPHLIIVRIKPLRMVSG